MPTWAMLSLQDSASSMMEELMTFHDFTMVIITIMTILVGFNMGTIMKYKLTDRFLLHNQTIEIIWTTVPIFILLSVAAPSLKALYMLDDPFSPSLTIKTIGHQWYWSYEYSNFQDLEFNSYMIPVEDLKNTDNRLLETDNNVILPFNTQIRMVVTAADVIHAWTVPSLGVKTDAVPGRLNQIMFSIKRPGFFYGQCSEICGANHSFMPIKLEVTPMEVFTSWVKNYK
uniref:cytochrome c oxidase subunit II n=1 Tax=Grandidierella taihuensis TaxID=2778875 RepID=UPI001BEE9A39|nr:cytochrome c oxidase subunit II [Grandidierella taihuensis]QTX95224.1 cytochrome c oxidase subunit II [Grandidierella taihuensis]